MRLQLVINPAAGGGLAMHALPKVEAALSSHEVLVTRLDLSSTPTCWWLLRWPTTGWSWPWAATGSSAGLRAR